MAIFTDVSRYDDDTINSIVVGCIEHGNRQVFKEEHDANVWKEKHRRKFLCSGVVEKKERQNYKAEQLLHSMGNDEWTLDGITGLTGNKSPARRMRRMLKLGMVTRREEGHRHYYRVTGAETSQD